VIALSRVILTVACLIAGFSLFSCVSTKPSLPYVLCEKYTTANLSARKVVLALPDEKNIVISNPKDVTDDYGGMNATPGSRITKFYLPLFYETFKSYTSGDSLYLAETYRQDFSFDSLCTRKVDLKKGQDTGTLHFSIPEKSPMLAAGLDSAVLVLVGRLTFKRNNFYIEYYWDDKTKRPANLEVEAEILIWDYKNDTPVLYGTITQKVEFQIAMQRKNWDESARLLAKKVVLSAKCL
jgi:hypothetical protein